MKHVDKVYHLAAGAAVAALFVFAGFPAWAVPAAAVAGIGKELYDKASGKGVSDPLDALATVAGGVIVAVLVM